MQTDAPHEATGGTDFDQFGAVGRDSDYRKRVAFTARRKQLNVQKTIGFSFF
jgi:hypothetical protein